MYIEITPELIKKFPLNVYLDYIYKVQGNMMKQYLNHKCIVFDFANGEDPFCWNYGHRLNHELMIGYGDLIKEYISEPVEIQLRWSKCIVYKKCLEQ